VGAPGVSRWHLLPGDGVNVVETVQHWWLRSVIYECRRLGDQISDRRILQLRGLAHLDVARLLSRSLKDASCIGVQQFDALGEHEVHVVPCGTIAATNPL
jgi:hypothetical protein